MIPTITATAIIICIANAKIANIISNSMKSEINSQLTTHIISITANINDKHPDNNFIILLFVVNVIIYNTNITIYF